jgi:dipeptide/tripeptide permease
MDHADAVRAVGLMSVLTIGGYLLGGLAALVAGPLPVIVAGALLCAAGTGAIGIAGESTVLIPIALASFGYGTAQPAVFAAAARHFGREGEQLRNALFVVLWVGVNLGALVAPPVTMGIRDALGFPALFAACAALLVLVAVVAAVAFGGEWFVGRQHKTSASGFTLDRPLAIQACVVLLLAFLPWALVFQVYDYLYLTYLEYGLYINGTSPETFMQINPVLIVVLGVLLAAGFSLFHATGVKIPTLAIAGAGLLLLAAGSLPMMFPRFLFLSPLLVLCLLVLALGEILAGPMLLSSIVGGWPWRLSTLIIALWLSMTRGTTLVVNWIRNLGDSQELSQAPLWLGIFLCAVVGLTFAIVAWPLRRVMAAPPREQS